MMVVGFNSYRMEVEDAESMEFIGVMRLESMEVQRKMQSGPVKVASTRYPHLSTIVVLTIQKPTITGWRHGMVNPFICWKR